jgi:hypothetical protein
LTRVVSLSEQEIGDNSIHRTAHFSTLQVDLRLSHLLLNRIDGGLSSQPAGLSHRRGKPNISNIARVTA